ncbi:MAG: PIN domain-containing protein [Nanoarchaeota archaeon]|nr:PIN domain-containing protein [Nanoarchaeota archaeon]MBU1028373.1 PIN domain-containing protein [Nanoarchaeota archaeon]
MKYFFDSYAIIEIINQNKNYNRFTEFTLITNTLHLAEVYYFLLRTHNEKTADYWIRNLLFTFMHIPHKISIKASKFRYKYKKKKLSYADCIGYVTALENNLVFLTGDSKFKNKDNVEFVK